MARRLVEAGVVGGDAQGRRLGHAREELHRHKDQLPQLDQGFHALVTDLYDRGLDKDVAVVMWGEFGRAPRISRGDGRDHWPEAGAAVVAGGGFKVGQVIGETDSHGGRSKGKPYTPSNVLASLYRHLGIDPATTIPDHTSRPMHVLDDREVVRELLARQWVERAQPARGSAALRPLATLERYARGTMSGDSGAVGGDGFAQEVHDVRRCKRSVVATVRIRSAKRQPAAL